MSTDNVTPIRPVPSPPRRRRKSRAKGPDLSFRRPDGDEPSSLRIFQGLRGVARAIEECGLENRDPSDDTLMCLGTAAAILSEMLDARYLSP